MLKKLDLMITDHPWESRINECMQDNFEIFCANIIFCRYLINCYIVAYRDCNILE